MTWKDREEQIVHEFSGQLCQYEERLSFSLWAMELHQYRDSTPHLYGAVSQILGLSIALLKREDIVVHTMHYPVILPAWPQRQHVDTRWKIYFYPRSMGVWIVTVNHMILYIVLSLLQLFSFIFCPDKLSSQPKSFNLFTILSTILLGGENEGLCGA